MAKKDFQEILFIKSAQGPFSRLDRVVIHQHDMERSRPQHETMPGTHIQKTNNTDAQRTP